MTKHLLLLLWISLASLNASPAFAQQKKSGRKGATSSARAAAQALQQKSADSVALLRRQFVEDSTLQATARIQDSTNASLAALADTVRKDTTLVQIIEDSVIAQITAPIVQVPVTLKSLIIPGVLFGYGVFTLNNGRLRKVNEEARELVYHGNEQNSLHIEDYTLLAPAAAVYVLNICGVKGNNNLVDRSIIYGMANLINNGLSFGIKKLGVETRPDSSDNKSFPSGHTSQAFVSAEFARQEYRGITPWPAVFGYTVAIGTAYLRMYHNKHWLNDVVAGAGVGIFSTRISYYLYPLLKHVLFGSKKIKGDAMILPTYQNGMFGVAGVVRF